MKARPQHRSLQKRISNCCRIWRSWSGSAAPRWRRIPTWYEARGEVRSRRRSGFGRRVA